MVHRVHARQEVTGEDPHRLLTHRGLVGVTRRLVVVGKGNDRAHHAQNERRMDLAVRPNLVVLQYEKRTTEHNKFQRQSL